jgi:hypothetical protein
MATNFVQVRSPNGKVASVPESTLDALARSGWNRIVDEAPAAAPPVEPEEPVLHLVADEEEPEGDVQGSADSEVVVEQPTDEE